MATITSEELNKISTSEQFKLLFNGKEYDDPYESKKLAMGIDPDEVLEFIGSREDLIAKFEQDIPYLAADRAKCEAAVDKLLMDGEMLDVYMKYNRRKIEDPEWTPYIPPEPGIGAKAANFFSQYGFWIITAYIGKDYLVSILLKQGVDVPEFLIRKEFIERMAEKTAESATVDTLVSSVMDGMHHLSNHIMV